MPTYAWVLLWAVAIAVLVVLAVRERRRGGPGVAPDALRRRREDTARMRAAAERYDLPKKDPHHG
ncbi:hypothetical protein SAMN04488570_2957 [Nocardioides scoriae]|uniref:Uncharacterized protein n=1 Tax=Nocardioides scoriae TaxID=642780 RepID=A0A1H1VXX7_9ACTN|nr:hypothetical protein [Nocardioides scoriae]SDS88929.1 hypothetical protein SAMN04488570_2957 [Nocardioides scoriae]